MDWAVLTVSIVAVLIALHAERRARGVESTSRQASLVPVILSRRESGVPGGVCLYEFSIRNVGASAARDVQLWLADHSGRKVSGETGTRSVVLAPTDQPLIGSVDLMEPLEPDDLEVWVSCTDDTGPHTKRVEVRFP